MKAAVLHDRLPENARADETDVLAQVAVVSDALRRLGYDPTAIPVRIEPPGMIEEILRLRPGFVFNLVESVSGRGSLIHLVPALLDALGIAYTGVGSGGMLATSNKLFTKGLLKGANLPTPAWHSITGLQNPMEFAPGRYILKSVWEHASIGLSDDSIFDARSYGEVMKRIEETRRRDGGEWFAEKYIAGREFNISVLSGKTGPQALPIAEIVFRDYPEGKPKIVGYAAKWDEESFEYRNTPRRFRFPDEDAPLLERLETLTRACWRRFELRGYARVDFRVDRRGEPYVLEVNANPCLSPDAGYAAALRESAIPFTEAVDRIVRGSIPNIDDLRSRDVAGISR